MTTSMTRRIGALAAGSAGAALAVAALYGSGSAGADSSPLPQSPTTSTAPSVAPANPVDCTDPNNVINCQAPPLDSPVVNGGTAAPGSPFRD